jgi:hypothetical protein
MNILCKNSQAQSSAGLSDATCSKINHELTYKQQSKHENNRNNTNPANQKSRAEERI